jgi:hypothetical protein
MMSGQQPTDVELLGLYLRTASSEAFRELVTFDGTFLMLELRGVHNAQRVGTAVAETGATVELR